MRQDSTHVPPSITHVTQTTAGAGRSRHCQHRCHRYPDMSLWRSAGSPMSELRSGCGVVPHDVELKNAVAVSGDLVRLTAAHPSIR